MNAVTETSISSLAYALTKALNCPIVPGTFSLICRVNRVYYVEYQPYQDVDPDICILPSFDAANRAIASFQHERMIGSPGRDWYTRCQRQASKMMRALTWLEENEQEFVLAWARAILTWGVQDGVRGSSEDVGREVAQRLGAFAGREANGLNIYKPRGAHGASEEGVTFYAGGSKDYREELRQYAAGLGEVRSTSISDNERRTTRRYVG